MCIFSTKTPSCLQVVLSPSLSNSDAPIPLFTNQSDTDIFCFEIGRYQYFATEELFTLSHVFHCCL